MKHSSRVAQRIIKGLKEFSDALENEERISEKFTCRKVMLDLHPVPYNSKSVKATRHLLNASQVVFAQFLGVKPSTVRSWEQGLQAPGEMACRFMDEIRHDPTYWQKRLKEAIRAKVPC